MTRNRSTLIATVAILAAVAAASPLPFNQASSAAPASNTLESAFGTLDRPIHDICECGLEDYSCPGHQHCSAVWPVSCGYCIQ